MESAGSFILFSSLPYPSPSFATVFIMAQLSQTSFANEMPYEHVLPPTCGRNTEEEDEEGESRENRADNY